MGCAVFRTAMVGGVRQEFTGFFIICLPGKAGVSDHHTLVASKG